MKSFWNSPYDETKFSDDFCRAMLMAIVVHIFHKDWGAVGSFGVITICFAWALFQSYVRFKRVPST